MQQEISIDKSAQMVGKTIDVMVEGYIAEDNTYVGRSYKDAPTGQSGPALLQPGYPLPLNK